MVDPFGGFWTRPKANVRNLRGGWKSLLRTFFVLPRTVFLLVPFSFFFPISVWAGCVACLLLAASQAPIRMLFERLNDDGSQNASKYVKNVTYHHSIFLVFLISDQHIMC